VNIFLLAALLRERNRLRSHERWSRDELEAYQARKLAEVRAFAVARSPFYAEHHRGRADAPLHALPPVSKATLMERFDDLVTDRDVHLSDVEAYLAGATATSLFRGRYRVAATGGTTGRRGVFLADPREWATVLASYARAYAWAGLDPSLTRRIRMAVVSSTNPRHQSAIVGATVASPFVPTLRLDAARPIGELVDELQAFQPDALVGYASTLRQLATEQQAGRLAIAPRAVFSASEVLTDEARGVIEAAFGVRPTNVYAATETAGIASECRAGHLHGYEDLVIAEIVDEDGRAVPAGQFGARLLVTPLASRTQPLIRYELSDRVAAATGAQPNDLPFEILAGIEGREEEVLELSGVRVHPNVFHAALEHLSVAGWQVVEDAAGLRVLVAGARDLDPATVASSVERSLAGAGAQGVPVVVELVDVIPRTALGKAPLIRRSAPVGAPAAH
jgi:putative adenylate-forming enzyme